MHDEKEKRILILHQGAIGDLLLSVPALRTIKNAYPCRRLQMLGFPATLALIKDMADTIASIDAARLSPLYGAFEDISSGLRSYLGGFERIFLFSARDSGTFIENARRCNPAALPVRTFPEGQQHVIDFQLAQLEDAGFAPADPVPRITILPENEIRAEKFLKDRTFGGRLIAVHPGSGGKKKNWPVGLFARLLHRLHAETQARFLIIQGPADEEQARGLAPGIAGLPYEIIENVDLTLAAALIARCALFVGNDSGMSHAAAAMGVPTVAIFGPTDPYVWGPRGASVSIVRNTGDAGRWKWPEPEEVFAAASRLTSQC